MTVEQVRTVHSTVPSTLPSTVVIVDSPSPITTHISQFTCLAGHKIVMNSAIQSNITLYKYPDSSPSLSNNHLPATEQAVLCPSRGK